MFLTATLPRFLKNILLNLEHEEGKSISFIEPQLENIHDKEIISLKRHKVKILDGNVYEHLDKIIKSKEFYKSTLVVCNHVSTAQNVFIELSKYETDIKLLHSRFTRRDRNKIENSLSNLLPKILVATQVIKVSLDIDFDQCFTEPASIDALIQRFGRVNRYGKKDPVTISVFSEQSGKYDIYKKELVQKSIQELFDVKDVIGEQETIDMADRIYGYGYTGDDLIDFNEALNHPKIKCFEDNLLAGVADHWVDEIIEKFDGSIDVLPRSLLPEYQRFEEEGLKLESLGLLLPMFKKKFFSLKSSTYLLDDGTRVLDIPYSSNIGLLSDVNINNIPGKFVQETFDNII
jgi:CRISPR-associated endonuclease/helicase Cas3